MCFYSSASMLYLLLNNIIQLTEQNDSTQLIYNVDMNKYPQKP